MYKVSVFQDVPRYVFFPRGHGGVHIPQKDLWQENSGRLGYRATSPGTNHNYQVEMKAETLSVFSAATWWASDPNGQGRWLSPYKL